MLGTHSPLIISATAETRYFAAESVLNTYVVHDLNDLDAYISCTLHELNSVVVRHWMTNYMHDIANN